MQVIRYTLARYLASVLLTAWWFAMSALYTQHGHTTRAIVYLCFGAGWAASTHYIAAKDLRVRAQLAELLEAAEFDVAQVLFTMNLSSFTRPEVKDLQLLLTCAALSPTAVKGNSALATAIGALRGRP